jgi:hypothetical protein
MVLSQLPLDDDGDELLVVVLLLTPLAEEELVLFLFLPLPSRVISADDDETADTTEAKENVESLS